jgi:hypothetical protein
MCKGYSRHESGDAALQEADSNAATCLSLVRPRAARAVAWAVEASHRERQAGRWALGALREQPMKNRRGQSGTRGGRGGGTE